MPILNDRYIVYGTIPKEYEVNDENILREKTKPSPIYTTDDVSEVKQIMKAGGFIRNDKWYAASYAVDGQTNQVVSVE